MQYCPKCKTEYEDHATMCVDCEVALVPNLEDHTFMMDLVRVKTNDSEEMIKYLEYSGITKYETMAEKDTLLIKVAQEEYETAVTYLKVYIHEHMEEDDTDDYYLDEYVSEEVDTGATVSDLKSTVVTFGIVGVGVLILALLNYFDIVPIRGFNKMILTGVLSVIGIGFLFVAVKTQASIGEAAETGSSKEDKINNMVDGYKSKYSMERFYQNHKIKKDSMDEGALYFLIFDMIKKEVKKMYPEEEDTAVNTVVERLYDELTEAQG